MVIYITFVNDRSIKRRDVWVGATTMRGRGKFGEEEKQVTSLVERVHEVEKTQLILHGVIVCTNEHI